MRNKVSVVILNWNGKDHLRKCLKSFETVSYKPLEIIVVDNASADLSVGMVRKEFPKVKIIQNEKNIGYSSGNNRGIKASTGEFVFILNNDTEVTKDFLTPLALRMNQDKNIGCIQPKLLYGDKRSILNAVGSFFTSSGFLYHYGYRRNSTPKRYNRYMPIFSAKGAAMLLRKSALKKIGLFDEDFFIFFEETDLCHRLWIAGYTVMYEPTSIIYHYEAVDTNRQMENFRRSYLSYRNRICSYLKNLEFMNIIKIFSVLFPIYALLFLYHLITFQFNQAWAIVMSFLWNMVQFPNTMKKRFFIQHTLRKVSDASLFPIIKKNPHPIYYYYLFLHKSGDSPYERII